MKAQSTGHSCIGLGTQRPTDTDVNRQTQIQAQAPALVSQSPGDVYLGSMEGQAEGGVSKAGRWTGREEAWRARQR